MAGPSLASPSYTVFLMASVLAKIAKDIFVFFFLTIFSTSGHIEEIRELADGQ